MSSLVTKVILDLSFHGLKANTIRLNLHIILIHFVFKVTDDLVHAVKGTEISIITEEIFDHDPLTRLQNLKV